MRKILGLTLALAFFTGCATISNQMSQRVAIGTNTGDAVTADINGQKVMLPASVKISRSNDTIVKILPVDNPGYEATQLVIVGKQNLSMWFWGQHHHWWHIRLNNRLSHRRYVAILQPQLCRACEKSREEKISECFRAKTLIFALRSWEFAFCKFPNFW